MVVKYEGGFNFGVGGSFTFQTFLESGRTVLVVTPLAENKTYMKWSNYWDQLILHGAIPFLGLALANIK